VVGAFFFTNGFRRWSSGHIESSLESGCDLSHNSAQDGCNGTCEMLEASKHLKWNMVHFKGSLV